MLTMFFRCIANDRLKRQPVSRYATLNAHYNWKRNRMIDGLQNSRVKPELWSKPLSTEKSNNTQKKYLKTDTQYFPLVVKNGNKITKKWKLNKEWIANSQNSRVVRRLALILSDFMVFHLFSSIVRMNSYREIGLKNAMYRSTRTVQCFFAFFSPLSILFYFCCGICRWLVSGCSERILSHTNTTKTFNCALNDAFGCRHFSNNHWQIL